MRVRRDLLGNRLTLDRQAASARVALAEPEAEIEPAVTVPIGDPARPSATCRSARAGACCRRSRRGLRDTFVAAGVATTVLAALIGLVVGRRMTAPISSLTSSARRMGDGDLGVRARSAARGRCASWPSPSTRWLPGSARPSRSCGRERDVLRRFVGDASHELRTPLTAVADVHRADEQAPGGRADA